MSGSQIENRTAGALESLEAIIKSGFLGVELIKPATKLPDLRDEIGVLGKDARNGVASVIGASIELGVSDDSRGKFEGNSERVAHNRPYVNRRPEWLRSSGRRPT